MNTIGICEKFHKERQIAIKTIWMLMSDNPKKYACSRSRVQTIYGNWLIKALAHPDKTRRYLDNAWNQSMQLLGEHV